MRQLALSWGAIPINTASRVDSLSLMDDLVIAARDAGHVRSGDLVAVLAGAGSTASRSTDVLRLASVP